jgi:hypothetical protein
MSNLALKIIEGINTITSILRRGDIDTFMDIAFFTTIFALIIIVILGGIIFVFSETFERKHKKTETLLSFKEKIIGTIIGFCLYILALFLL